MNKNIAIVHYNTPKLTECLVGSINKHMDDAIIYIFDNSDEYPFVAQFDNVRYIDNTKGEVINFDEWLLQFPDREKTIAKNNYASAKHTYSVEKLMELIDEPFILLDSDTLVKKDLSELYNENLVYQGEVVMQVPSYNIKRVLPHLCYINTNMCKEENVHFFNQNYMHGLGRKKNNGDYYDSGAFFYLAAKDLPHGELNSSDYVEHYMHGSWVKKGYEHPLTQDQWLEKHITLWENFKKVVYTCITNGYDKLLEPSVITDGWDYICFTDDKTLTSNTWTIKPMPIQTNRIPNNKKQRYVKINAHKVLGEYDISIWVDGNVELRGDLNELLHGYFSFNTPLYLPKHPHRDCIYDEGMAVITSNKDSREIVEPQMERYRKEGFPTHFGLLQSNIMLRKHNECIKLMEMWWNELKKGSHRDQLSFNYTLWKYPMTVKWLYKTIYNSKWFNWHPKHTHVCA